MLCPTTSNYSNSSNQQSSLMGLGAEIFRIVRVLEVRARNMRTPTKRDISREDLPVAPTLTTADRVSKVGVLRGASGGVDLAAMETEELAELRVNSMTL